nr:hypothetical protein [Lujinxingiaceae bacterium]
DVYGRRLPSLLARQPETLIAELRQLHVGELRAGFRLEDLRLKNAAQRPQQQARALLAGFALLSTVERQTALTLLADTLADSVSATHDQGCAELGAIGALGDELRVRATGPDAQPDDRELAHHASWLATSVYAAACQGTAAFEEASLRWAQSRSARLDLVFPFFDGLLGRHARGGVDAERVERLARLSATLGGAEQCRRLNLALATALTRDGQLEAAERHLLLFSNCGGSADTYAGSRSTVASYIAHERSGQWPASRQANHQTACIGLQPLGLDLLSQIEPEIAQLAASIQLAPVATSDFLQLRTASTVVSRGEAAFQVARRALAEGRPLVAARSLQEARADFQSIKHLAGLARIAFLETVIFEGNLQGAERLSAARPAALPRDLDAGLAHLPEAALASLFRAGHARRWLADFDAAPQVTDARPSTTLGQALIAASIIVEDDASTQLRWQAYQSASGFERLCEVSLSGDSLNSQRAP